MKLLKTESPYLDKPQIKKIALATTIMTLVLYAVAMVFSLCGSKYFILDYQNPHMDNTEAWLIEHNLLDPVNYLYMLFEFTVILCFVLKSKPKWYYLVSFYGISLLVFYLIPGVPSIFYTGFAYLIYFLAPIFEQLLSTKVVNWKEYGKSVLRLAISAGVSFILQVIIYAIKTGSFSMENHVQKLSIAFIYAIEYEIALSIILYTLYLYLDREKGDSLVCHNHSGSSQTSTKQSLKSLTKNLTKTQKNKLFWLYTKFYLIQTFGFLLVMILPFLLGKVFEFLVMYAAFAIVRYILGFNYSLHFKKESICITVGVLVFGILSLAVPFFTVVTIIAVFLGVALAILLHLSYKYKSMWLFKQVSKPDKFAVLYVIFDGDLSEYHVKKMCRYKGLDKEQTALIYFYTQGDKISYLAYKFSYSIRMINYKLDEAIEKLDK